MRINERDIAVFEAGIKLGALYHQFVGTPVSVDTIEELEKAIEKSIGLQPYVKSISVTIDRKMVEDTKNIFGYCELEGRMLHVTLKLLYKNILVEGELSYDDKKNYPMMKLKDIVEISDYK